MSEYQLKEPLLGMKRGEILTYDETWNEWVRKATGEEWNLRSDVKTGEKVLLLNYLVSSESTSILTPQGV